MSDRGRLTDAQAAAVLANAVPLDRPPGASSLPLRPFSAERLDGDVVVITPSTTKRQLLLFVSETCEGCQDLFDAASTPLAFGLGSRDELLVLLRELPDDKGDGTHHGAAVTPRPSWLISPEAYERFQVTSAPFFVLMDPAFATVATEGVAWGPASVRSAVEQAIAGAPSVEAARLDGPPA